MTVPPASIGQQSPVAGQQANGQVGDWGSGGARLLVTDSGVAALLMDDARRRLLARLFGVPTDKTALVTIIGAGLVAREIHDRAVRVLKVPIPSLGDAAIVAGAAKDLTHVVAGDWSREYPMWEPLLGIVALGVLVRPVLRWSFGDVRAASHRARVAFDHRYGHMVRSERVRAYIRPGSRGANAPAALAHPHRMMS